MYSKKYHYLYTITLGLIAFGTSCNRAAFTHVSNAKLNTFDTSWKNTSAEIDALIVPYREQIKKEMDQVVGYSAKEMIKARPESALGNALADMLLSFGLKEIDSNIDLCVMNYGGFRVPIPEGPVTRGKVFELMPFENTLCVVTISKDQLEELANQIMQNGGEPIASKSPAQLVSNNGRNSFIFSNGLVASKKEYTVITSNYLADGGDGFSVFKQHSSRMDSNWLIRSAIIKSLKENTSIEYPLNGLIDGRIKIVNHE